MVLGPVIFTAALDAYAIRAFQARGVACLLKPVKLAELQAALAKLHHAMRNVWLAEESRMRNEELHPAPAEEIPVSREKAPALNAWLEG